MSNVGMRDLIAALASAVSEAEQIVRVHQIRNLRSFFNDNNEPKTVELTLPQLGDGAGRTPTTLHVPLITLINAGSMSISEMDIKFSAALGGVSGAEELSAVDSGATSFAVGAEPASAEGASIGWSATPGTFSVDVSPDTLKASDTGAASVRLKVRQVDVPEGLARVISKLSSSL